MATLAFFSTWCFLLVWSTVPTYWDDQAPQTASRKLLTQTLLRLHPAVVAVHLSVPGREGYHQDVHYSLFPIQGLILNLAMVSILIPHTHFWKHLLNY